MRSYLITLIILGTFIVLIPYLIYKNSFFTCLYIYVGIIFYFLIGIGLSTWIAKMLRKIFYFPRFNFMDISLTMIILVVAVPIICVLSLVAMVLMLIPRFKYHTVYALSTIILFVLGVRVHHVGSLPSQKLGPFIVTPNHSSFIDYFLILHTMGTKPYNVVAGLNLKSIPIFRYFLKKYAIGIDRQSQSSKMKTWREMINTLKRCFNLAVFPGGGRIKFEDAEKLLEDFKEGPFRAAIETNSIIVPIVYSLPFLYLGKGEKRWWIKPQTIKIIFCDPIFPENLTVEELMEKTHKVMLEKLNGTKKVKKFLSKK